MQLHLLPACTKEVPAHDAGLHSDIAVNMALEDVFQPTEECAADRAACDRKVRLYPAFGRGAVLVLLLEC